MKLKALLYHIYKKKISEKEKVSRLWLFSLIKVQPNVPTLLQTASGQASTLRILAQPSWKLNGFSASYFLDSNLTQSISTPSLVSRWTIIISTSTRWVLVNHDFIYSLLQHVPYPSYRSFRTSGRRDIRSNSYLVNSVCLRSAMSGSYSSAGRLCPSCGSGDEPRHLSVLFLSIDVSPAAVWGADTPLPIMPAGRYDYNTELVSGAV